MSNSALENFKRDFENKLNDSEFVEIEFPEIGMPCFARSALTGFRKGKILAALKENQLSFCAEVIINCAVHKNGTYIFKSGEKHDLLRECDSSVIERVSGDICTAIFGDADIEEALASEEEVAAKNSKETKS